MEFSENKPPRTFTVGVEASREIRDCGTLHLEPDEQVTFLLGESEYDVVRKDWGFYATPSLNGRLLDNGLHAVLVRNRFGKFYVFLVEDGRTGELQRHLDEDQISIVTWLDTDEALDDLVRGLALIDSSR